jgi:hypothetical protein
MEEFDGVLIGGRSQNLFNHQGIVYSENKAEGRRQTAEGIKIFIGGAVLKVHDPLN